MTKNEALAILSKHRHELQGYGVRALSLFGSVARDEAEASSDVDLLVEFSQPVGMFAFLRLKLFLEQVLGHKVDLVTWDAVRPEMRERLKREALRAA
jgi:predicted nucleotidyltransferase